MEQRLSLVTLGVGDLDRARQFYEQGLGWTASPASQGAIAFYQLGGMVLALFGRDALAADAAIPAGPKGFAAIALAYNARSKAEVATIMAQATAAGAIVTKPAEDTFWGGHSGYFTDPDGHLWEIAWNPFWTIAEDGSVTIG